MSTPDCAVAQVRLAGLSYLFVSAYFDGNRDIVTDLDHLDTFINSAPGGRLLVHADVNSRDKLWHDNISNPRGLVFADSLTIEKIFDWQVNDEMELLSDHRLIQFSLTVPLSSRFAHSTRCFSHFAPHLDKLRSSAVDLQVVWSENLTLPGAVEEFGEQLVKICCDNLPPKRLHKRKRSLLWRDADVRSARASKNRLISRLKNCSTIERSTVCDQLEAAVSHYRCLIVTKGQLHWRAITKTVGSDRIYNLLRSLVRPNFKPLFGHDELLLSSDAETAEHLVSTFFGEQLTNPSIPTPSPQLPVHQDHTPVEMNEIQQIIFSFGRSKAPGPDGITPDILRSLFNACPSSFVDCINLCLRHSIFPQLWKNGSVIMIPKDRPGPAVAKSF